MAQSGEARYGQFPGFLQHIEARDHESEGGKAEGEDGEGGQEFPNRVELRQRYDGQESPQPVAPGVLEFALHGSLLIFFERRPTWDEGRGRRSAYLVVGQVRWCWMTMCTFTQFRRSGNARGVNCGWTGGEPSNAVGLELADG
jgi:hypothetical protein